MATDIQRLVPYGCNCPICQQQPDGPTAEEHQDINRLVAASDERGRRRLVGFLARQRGRGGIALLARITGLSPHTIRKGQHELRQPDSVPPGRVRRPGGGRRRVAKKRPRW